MAREDMLVVEDLRSTNGTFVNGRRVERAALGDGDRLTVGRIDFAVSRCFAAAG
jgi:pSer/pThr/pTyr-binding forkhead associated (FHA) protein